MPHLLLGVVSRFTANFVLLIAVLFLTTTLPFYQELFESLQTSDSYLDNLKSISFASLNIFLCCVSIYIGYCTEQIFKNFMGRHYDSLVLYYDQRCSDFRKAHTFLLWVLCMLCLSANIPSSYSFLEVAAIITPISMLFVLFPIFRVIPLLIVVYFFIA